VAKEHLEDAKMLIEDMMESKPFFQKIEAWCLENPGTHSGLGLARLVLSLYNERAFPYSLSRCLHNLDETRSAWAKALVDDFFERGETDELCLLAERLRFIVEEALPPAYEQAKEHLEDARTLLEELDDPGVQSAVDNIRNAFMEVKEYIRRLESGEEG
jgi:hypothetical protein